MNLAVPPTILAVTADATASALEQAAAVGMKGFMTKPFKLLDLQRLILEYCASREKTPTTIGVRERERGEGEGGEGEEGGFTI